MSRKTDLYQVDGIRVPSVTEILKIAGLINYDDAPSSLLERKRRIGTEVHQWCEMIDQQMLEPEGVIDDEEISGYVGAYLAFCRDAQPKIIECEQPVVNERYRYAGTLDRTLEMTGLHRPLAVLDIKTGEPAKWMALQLAGYEMCLEQPHRRFSLHLRADRTYRLVQYMNPSDKHDFLSACRVAHWKLRHGLASIT
jgi:hypothetical protein